MIELHSLFSFLDKSLSMVFLVELCPLNSPSHFLFNYSDAFFIISVSFGLKLLRKGVSFKLLTNLGSITINIAKH